MRKKRLTFQPRRQMHRGDRRLDGRTENCRKDLDSISVPTGIIVSSLTHRVYTGAAEFTEFVVYSDSRGTYDRPGRSDDRVRQRLFPALPASFAPPSRRVTLCRTSSSSMGTHGVVIGAG